MATAISQVAFISTGIPSIEKSLIEPRKCSEVPFAKKIASASGNPIRVGLQLVNYSPPHTKILTESISDRH